MKKVILILLIVLISYPLVGQNPPADPKLKSLTEENWVKASDYMREKNYREAANSLHWIMTNVPDYFAGVYIHAYRAYEQLGIVESDKEQKGIYLDSMLISYKLKEKYFDLSIREKNNLAFKYYKHFRNDPSKYDEAMIAYGDAYKVPEKVISNNIVSYMSMAARYKEAGNAITNDQIFEIYGLVTEAINSRIQMQIDAEKFQKYQIVVDGILLDMIGNEISCADISDTFGPALDQDQNLKKAKRMFAMMLNLECTDNPYFIKSAKIIWDKEENKSEGIAKLLAKHNAVNKDYATAIYWYESAFGVSSSNEKKADIQMDLANIHLLNGDKIKSRVAALKAIELNSEIASEAYSFLGNLYMRSFDDCKQESSHVQDRAVFMLAYDMFEKAGDKDGKLAAMAQFPTKSQVFEKNLKAGDPIKIECWIQRSTTIKSRASN